MPTVLRFTQPFLRSVTSEPPSKQTDYTEQKTPGFGLRVNPGGSASFFVAYRMRGGKKGRFKIGRYPAVDLKTARTEARRIVAQVARGIDPQEERRLAKQAEQTVGDLIAQFQRDYVEARGLKSAGQQRRFFDRDILPVLGKVPLSQLKRRDLQSLVDVICSREALVSANRAFAYLRKALNWGLQREMFEANVWSAVELPGRKVEKPRTTMLKERELKPYWQACEEQGNVGLLQQLILLTAARPGEVRTMRWDQVDFDEGWWTIPEGSTKNGKAHRVWLAPLTRQLLQELLQVSESDWVFPGLDPKKPLQEYRRGRAAINAQAGTDVTSHDLRRTAATLMVSKAGVPREIVARVLNHTDRDVTAIYVHASYDEPKRKAWEAWCAYLTKTIVQ